MSGEVAAGLGATALFAHAHATQVIMVVLFSGWPPD